ncbi:uncharacterized protein EDB91DRAFT_830857 [Suillus paluster]|uniref:uncharacterized protein n=1 Tax=Suillus paluster TaxID=48578 RepID=UPI001B87E7FC|nr:uncharacterized protein EDB91DRAFT_830857 [Suillus paluster]KAG1749035.1 hypothetical protein EDB91DRAFT_830857 [Suillus paluster]
MIHHPYSSNPRLTSSLASTRITSHGVKPLQREAKVLNLLKVRADAMLDDSSLHIERENSFNDLLDLQQPRSRLEDLVRDRAVMNGIVDTHPPLRNAGVYNHETGEGWAVWQAHWICVAFLGRLLFSELSISFTPMQVKLVLPTSGGQQHVVDVAETQNEKLEDTAKAVAAQLKAWHQVEQLYAYTRRPRGYFQW